MLFFLKVFCVYVDQALTRPIMSPTREEEVNLKHSILTGMVMHNNSASVAAFLEPDTIFYRPVDTEGGGGAGGQCPQ